MALIQLKYCFLRHLMMSLALLWAVALQGSAVYACDTAAPAVQHSLVAETLDQAGGNDHEYSLQSGKLYLAEEGTESTRTHNLQPAARNPKPHAITFSSQQAVPLYMARAPGDCFFCLFYYTSSQPQAP